MNNSPLAGMLAGFVGGLVAAYVAIHFERPPGAASTGVAAAAPRQDVVSASRIRLVDAGGRTRAELAMSVDGGPALFFFDTAGRNRLVAGLYSPGEGEFPFVVLNDTQQHAAGIFRVFGAHESPVVVLKSQGRDRSIFGLNPGTMEPFLVNYSGDGKKSEVFGNY
jgi:hypothetical protein